MTEQQVQAESRPVPVQQQSTSNKMADTAFICGFLGLLSFWVPFLGVILAALGIAFGIIGFGHASSVFGNGRVLAILGIALGATTLLITFVAVNRIL